MLCTALLVLGALGLGAAEPSSPIYPVKATPTTTTQSRWMNESTSTSASRTSISSSSISLLTPSTRIKTTTYPDAATISFTLFNPSTTPGADAANSTSSNNGTQTPTSAACVQSTEGVLYVTTTITTFIGTVFVAPNATIGLNSTYSTITGSSFCSASFKGFSTSVGLAPSPSPITPVASPASVPVVTITSTNAISVVLTSPPGPAVTFTDGAPGSSPTHGHQPSPPDNLPVPGLLGGTGVGSDGTPSSGGGGGHSSGSNDGGSNGSPGSSSSGNTPPGSSNGRPGPPSSGGRGGGGSGAGSGNGNGNSNGSPGSSGAGSNSGGSPGNGNPGNSGSPSGSPGSGSHGGSSGGSPGSVSGPSLGSSGVIINGNTVSQDPSHNIVLQGVTFTGGFVPTPIVLNGQSWTLLPSNAGVVAPGGMTLSAAAAGITPAPSPSLGLQGIQLNPSNPSQIIIAGSTIALPTLGSTVLALAGETYTLGPSAIIAGSSTVPLPSAVTTPPAIYTAETVDGVPFDIGSTVAIINGQTLSIGPDAPTTTLTVGSEIITVGPNGIVFPTTTIAPLPSIEVIDGITLSLEASDIVISGTTYPFSKATTLVLGGTETITIGSGGVTFPHTTLGPIASTTGTSLPSLTQVGPKVTGSGAAARASPTNAASASRGPSALIRICASVLTAALVGTWCL